MVTTIRNLRPATTRSILEEHIEATHARGYDAAFRSWLTAPSGRAGSYTDGLVRVQNAENLRALGVGVSVSAGYLVSPEFDALVIQALNDPSVSPVRSVATVRTTATGADLNVQTVDDTSQEGELVAEGGSISEADVSLGRRVLRSYAFSSKVERVSFQLLADADTDPNFEPWLAGVLAARIGRGFNRYATVGTGPTQPEGISTSAFVGITGVTGQTVTMTWGDVVGLQNYVAPAYRFKPGAGYMLHPSSMAYLRTIVDGSGRPLITSDPTLPGKWFIDGYPAYPNSHMGSMSASAKSLLFGDFSSYIVRQVSGGVMLRLDELYALSGQVGFLYLSRMDGLLIDAGTHPVACFVHSAS